MKHDDINYNLLKYILELYHRDPTSHYELVYKLLHDIRGTHVIFNAEGYRVKGYCLYYMLCDEPTLQVYGDIDINRHLLPLIDELGLKEISVTIPEHLAHRYLPKLREAVEIRKERILNRMLSTRIPDIDTEKYRVVKLGEDHLEEFLALKKMEGIRCSREEALRQLMEYLYLGIFMDDKLVSIGAAYIRLPEVWAIGGIYTHPDYRNLGLGTIISGELTRRAWLSGGKAVLKVEEDNLPAFKVFTKTGYKVVGRERYLTIET